MMRSTFVMALAAALVGFTGVAVAQSLDTNVLENGGWENNDPGTGEPIDGALGAGFWGGDTDRDGTADVNPQLEGKPFSDAACGGNAWWSTDAVSRSGASSFYWPVIGWRDPFGTGCDDVDSDEFAPEVQWLIDPRDYIDLGANQVNVTGYVNVESMEAGKEIIVQAFSFEHLSNGSSSFDNVTLVGGTAGWQLIELTADVAGDNTVSGFKVIAADATDPALGPGDGVGIAGTIYLDDFSVTFSAAAPPADCEGDGAGDGTETGDNFSNFTMSKVDTAPVVDGSIGADEYATDVLILNASSAAASGSAAVGTTDGPDCDVSMEMWLGWDDDALYIGARVYDEDVQYLQDVGSLNSTDGVQLALDHTQLGAGGANGVDEGIYIFSITPGLFSDNNTPGFQNFWPNNNSPYDFPNTEVASSITATGYEVEAKLLWSDFLPAYTPSVNDQMGYMAFVLDYDGGNPETVYANQPGGFGTLGATAELWATLTLGFVDEGATGDDTISSSVSGFVSEGQYLVLTAPEGTSYQWKKDGSVIGDDAPRLTGTNERDLIFDTVVEADSGVYTVVYDDGATKAILETPGFVLDVLPANSVPATGMLGMALLAGLLGAAGVAGSRKRK